MKYLQPFYYDDFKCVGDKCIDNCCHGWGIDIDRKSFVKYRKIKGEFGRKLNKSIKRRRKESAESCFGEFILENDKCPLLNSEGLCELFINEGEKSLCNTCTYYPRVGFKYKNIIERNLNLSCPEVARQLVECTGKFEFVLRDGNEAVEKTHIDLDVKGNNDLLYDMLWETRSLAIDIAQLSELNIFKRLMLVEFLVERIQKLIEAGEIVNYNKTLDKFASEINGFNGMNDIKRVNNIIKLQVIFQIIENKIVKLSEVSDLLKLIEGKSVEEARPILDEKEEKFNEYFKNREYILENYIVYLLYGKFMMAMDKHDVHREMIFIMINYACVKLMLMARWIKNGDELSDDDIIEVMYKMARSLEHSTTFFDQIYNWVKENKLDTPGYLATLIF